MRRRASIYLFLSILVLSTLMFVFYVPGVLAGVLRSSMMSLTADWSFEGDRDGEEMGYAVSAAGDINNDGYADVIVGARRDYVGEVRTGAAYVFRGAPGGLPDFPNQTLDGDELTGGELFGAAVSGAGDVNADGFDDVIVGTPGYGKPAVGAAFVYFGASSLTSNPSPDWTYVSKQREVEFGFAVSEAGDVNDDGYDDVIIGARWYSETLNNEGAAFVFYGSSSGLGDEPVWSFACGQASATCGAAVGTAGDVNGDGYDDVVVGAPTYGIDDEGAVFVFYGSERGPSSQPDWSFSAEASGARFGTSVSAAGDVNGDGLSDLVVGAPHYGDNVGALFVFFGAQDTGLAETPRHIFMGDETGAKFGVDVGSAGDANGDGYADVVVGMPFFGEEGVEGEQKDEGASWIFYGSPVGLLQSQSWRAEGDKAATEFGTAVSTAGDVNGDGYADLIVGAPRYKRDESEAHGAAFAYLRSDMPQITIYSVFLPLVLRSPP